MHIRIAKIAILLAYIGMTVFLLSFFMSRAVTVISAICTGVFFGIIIVCGTVDIVKSIKEDKPCNKN